MNLKNLELIANKKVKFPVKKIYSNFFCETRAKYYTGSRISKPKLIFITSSKLFFSDLSSLQFSIKTYSSHIFLYIFKKIKINNIIHHVMYCGDQMNFSFGTEEKYIKLADLKKTRFDYVKYKHNLTVHPYKEDIYNLPVDDLIKNKINTKINKFFYKKFQQSHVNISESSAYHDHFSKVIILR